MNNNRAVYNRYNLDEVDNRNLARIYFASVKKYLQTIVDVFCCDVRVNVNEERYPKYPAMKK